MTKKKLTAEDAEDAERKTKVGWDERSESHHVE
jgi:hypothetical protein